MIDRAQLAEAARNADAIAEEIGVPAWAERQGLDPTALHYIAEQRAMRVAYLIIDQGDPTVLQTGFARKLKLSATAESLMPVFMACIVDGFAIGKTVRDVDEGQG